MQNKYKETITHNNMSYLHKFLIFITLLCYIFVMACSNIKNNQKQTVFNVIVAQDGSGDFTKIQDAIDNAPENLKSPWLIFVKNGSYKETVLIPENKPFIHLIGQNKEKTIIHEKLHVGAIPKPDSEWYKSDSAAWEFSVHNPQSIVYKKQGAVVIVNSTDFYAENISFINSFGVEVKTGPQALALKITADKNAFKNCSFRSFQDTWQTSSNDQHRLYVNNCWIEGAVDYFYGGGDALVENSTFYNVRSGSVIVAPCQVNAAYGYVFRNCIVDGNEESTSGSHLVKLGRPWHNAPRAVYINTTMRIQIDPEGWTNMGAVPTLFAEYDSRDTNGNTLDLSQRKSEYEVRGNNSIKGISRTTITKEEADEMVYENIILRNEDNWDPRLLMEAPPAPKGLKISGSEVFWTPVSEAIGYIVFDEEQILGITAESTWNLTSVPNSFIQVCAVSKYGVLSEKSNSKLE